MDSGIREMRFAVIATLLLAATTTSAHAATITVTNTNDSGPGSLRQALANANNSDRINFAVTGAITLTSGGLGVFKNVAISGPGADQLSIDGNQSPTQPVFSVSATATISGLTIRNGQDGIDNFGILTVRNCILSGNSFHGISNSSGSSLTVVNSNVSDNVIGISNHAIAFGAVTATIVSTTVSGNSGGGILTSVDAFGVAGVTVTDSTVSSNSGYGGIYGAFRMTVTNSTITGNSSADNGGGIYGTSASIVNSTISGNSAETNGGGIYDNGGLSIVNSTISGNSAGTTGGGIYCGFTYGIVNSTISGNSAGTSGGGIYHFYSTLAVGNSTITGNSAGLGGGVYNKQGQLGDSDFFFSHVILNAGASGENIFNDGGTVTSEGYNLSSDDGGGYLIGPGDQINTDPLLGPLQDNGGPTLTHALLPGSPAIDAGDPKFSPPPSTDQRGCPFDRVFDGRIDIGSFETQPPRRPCPSPRPRPTPRPR